MLVLICLRVVSPFPNIKAGGSSFVGLPQLLIQQIYNYLVYLEVTSSILNLRTWLAVVTDPHIMSPNVTVLMSVSPVVGQFCYSL